MGSAAVPGAVRGCGTRQENAVYLSRWGSVTGASPSSFFWPTRPSL